MFGYPGGAILPAYDAFCSSPSATCSSVTSRARPTWPTGTRGPAAGSAWPSPPPARAPPTSPPASPPRCSTRSPPCSSPARSPSKLAGQRRLPGDGRHRHHPAHHQAQHAGDGRDQDIAHCDARGASRSRAQAGPGRCCVDICKDAQQAQTEFVWPGDGPVCRGRGSAPAGRAEKTAKAAELIAPAERPLILAGHGVMRVGRYRRRSEPTPRRRTRPSRLTSARHRRLPGQPPPLPGHDGHARRGLREHAPSRTPTCSSRFGHALRRPRHRQARDLRAARTQDPRRDRPLRDQQERAGGRRHRGRPARACIEALLPTCSRRSGTRPGARASSAGARTTTRPRDILHQPDNGQLYAAHVMHDLWTGHRRRRGGGDRRGPAPDVGGAVLPAREAAHAHHLGRPGHHGLRPARGHRRQDRAARTPRSG